MCPKPSSWPATELQPPSRTTVRDPLGAILNAKVHRCSRNHPHPPTDSPALGDAADAVRNRPRATKTAARVQHVMRNRETLGLKFLRGLLSGKIASPYLLHSLILKFLISTPHCSTNYLSITNNHWGVLRLTPTRTPILILLKILLFNFFFTLLYSN